MTEFFEMGGYAAYVWPSYGIAALVLVWLLGASWRSAHVAEAEVERLRAAGHDPRRKSDGRHDGIEIGGRPG